MFNTTRGIAPQACANHLTSKVSVSLHYSFFAVNKLLNFFLKSVLNVTLCRCAVRGRIPSHPLLLCARIVCSDHVTLCAVIMGIVSLISWLSIIALNVRATQVWLLEEERLLSLLVLCHSIN